MVHPLGHAGSFDDPHGPPAAAQPRVEPDRRRPGRRQEPGASVLRWALAIVLALGAVMLQVVDGNRAGPSVAASPPPAAGAGSSIGAAGSLDEGVAFGLLQAIRGAR